MGMQGIDRSCRFSLRVEVFGPRKTLKKTRSAKDTFAVKSPYMGAFAFAAA